MNDATEKTHLWTLTTGIRWSDMDAMGHVNNSIYFRYFEMTRMQWWDSLGTGVLGSNDIGMVVADSHCEYLLPIVYPATIKVDMSGGVPGRSSFNSYFTIHTEDGALCTRGSARIVWYDNQRGASTPIPAAVVAMLPTPDEN